MDDRERSHRGTWIAALALACYGGALIALHGFTLGYPFLADDYLFLESAVASEPWNPFGGVHVATNYFRPIGREFYFLTLTRVFGTEPVPFHLFNWIVLLGTVAMVFLLARTFLGIRGGVLAAGAYAMFYPHRIAMAWVSCVQDLLATASGVAAVLLYLRGRKRWAAVLFFLGLFAKESIAALPLVLFGWEAWQGARGFGERMRWAWRATASLWVAALAWGAVVLVARFLLRAWWSPTEGTLPVADVALRADRLWEGFQLSLLTYVALEQPIDLLTDALYRTSIPWLAIALVVAGTGLTMAMPAVRPKREESTRGWRLGLLWATVGILPVTLVGHHFSAYYVGFGAVGFALLAGWVLGRTPAPVAATVLAAAAWASATANAVEPFRLVSGIEERRGVSHMAMARLEWHRKHIEPLEAALRRAPPDKGSVIYVAHAPPYFELATFGAPAPRIWFRDPSLDLSYITHYERSGPRPSRILRFDEERWQFVVLPNALVDAILEGEGALAAGHDARPALERAIALAATGPYSRERVELENSYGLACYRMGDMESARGAWTRSLSIDPAHRGALLNLAASHAGGGRYQEARDLTLRVLARAPEDSVGLIYLARLARALGNAEECNRAWQTLVSAHPAFADSIARTMGVP